MNDRTLWATRDDATLIREGGDGVALHLKEGCCMWHPDTDDIVAPVYLELPDDPLEVWSLAYLDGRPVGRVCRLCQIEARNEISRQKAWARISGK